MFSPMIGLQVDVILLIQHDISVSPYEITLPLLIDIHCYPYLECLDDYSLSSIYVFSCIAHLDKYISCFSPF